MTSVHLSAHTHSDCTRPLLFLWNKPRSCSMWNTLNLGQSCPNKLPVQLFICQLVLWFLPDARGKGIQSNSLSLSLSHHIHSTSTWTLGVNSELSGGSKQLQGNGHENWSTAPESVVATACQHDKDMSDKCENVS